MHIDAKHFDLALKRFKSTHKSSLFTKKLKFYFFNSIINADDVNISVLQINVNTSNVIHFNEITIHNFSQQVVKTFTKIIDNYSKF